MNPWLLIFLFIIVLLLLYALAFYLGTLFNAGSPLRIRLAYLLTRAGNRLRETNSSRKTDSDQRTLYPQNLPQNQESPAPDPAEAAPPDATTQPRPIKPPAQSVRKKAPQAATPSTMTAPSSKPFSRQAARQAIAEQRRVWIKYLDGGKVPVEDKLEIYKTTIDGNLLAWFASKHKCETFLRRRTVAWRLLDETFERSGQVERWARREALLGLPKRLYLLLKRDD